MTRADSGSDPDSGSGPPVAVVGGGVTGLGVARDLALRGARVRLFDRGGLAGGTSGRMHALLHSGARYAPSDPDSARACARESRTVREIAPHCVDPTGGLFVARPEDSDDYFQRKRRACEELFDAAGLDDPVVLSGREAREREPELAADVDRAIAVPDAVVDPFRIAAATAVDAEANGATVETDTPVRDLIVEDGRVVGVAVDRSGREVLRADHVVNAAGAWADRVAARAGATVEMAPSRGAMVAVDRGDLSTVVNRCRPRSEGDIVVPVGDRTVLGTTDRPVEDPDDYPRRDEEVELLRSELASVVPRVADAPVRGTYWGVRPLYAGSVADHGESHGREETGDGTGSPDETDAATTGSPAGDAAGPDGPDRSTDRTRSFAVLDHAARDDRPGLTTVVGGKLTTHRLMAEATADVVADRLGLAGECRTADRPLPGPDDPAVADALDRFGPRPPVPPVDP